MTETLNERVKSAINRPIAASVNKHLFHHKTDASEFIALIVKWRFLVDLNELALKKLIDHLQR